MNFKRNQCDVRAFGGRSAPNGKTNTQHIYTTYSFKHDVHFTRRFVHPSCDSEYLSAPFGWDSFEFSRIT